ncbi:MAG: PAS domain-containing protein [Ruminococcus sp.]|nr:PAS domain-containing protein [Ruminococcus sp.]
MSSLYKAVLDADRAPVVLCEWGHKIVYMNPAAIRRYAKWGGEKLIGKSLLDCHNEESQKKIHRVLDWFMLSRDNNIVYTFRNDKENKDVYMVALRDDDGALIGYYEKHEYRDRETMKLYCME